MQPDAAAAGNLASAQVPPANGSAGEAAKSWSGLSEGNRGYVESKGWKEGDIDKIVTSYAELEKYQGQSLKLPSENASPEELSAFRSKLPASMRPPEKPDGYDFKIPSDLPPDLPYSAEFAAASKAWMHKAGLSPSQAQAIHDDFVRDAARQQAAQAAEAQQVVAQRVTATHDDLVKAWGPQDSEGFKKKHALADIAIKKLGLVDGFKETGFLLEDGTLIHPQLAKAFAEIGEKMFGEDTIDLSGNIPEGGNPFKKDAKGNRNVTAISALVRNDPDRAKRLCQEAGERWSEWASSNPL